MRKNTSVTLLTDVTGKVLISDQFYTERYLWLIYLLSRLFYFNTGLLNYVYCYALFNSLFLVLIICGIFYM